MSEIQRLQQLAGIEPRKICILEAPFTGLPTDWQWRPEQSQALQAIAQSTPDVTSPITTQTSSGWLAQAGDTVFKSADSAADWINSQAGKVIGADRVASVANIATKYALPAAAIAAALYGGKKLIDWMRGKNNESVGEGAVKQLGVDLADAFYDRVSKYVDDHNDVFKGIVQAWTDSDENPPEWALDDVTKNTLIQAGHLENEAEEPAELESVNETTSVGHVDDERSMMMSDLYHIAKNSVTLLKMLKSLPDDSDFPHWWQSKLVKANDYIQGAHAYLEAELAKGEAPEHPSDDTDPSGVS